MFQEKRAGAVKMRKRIIVIILTLVSGIMAVSCGEKDSGQSEEVTETASVDDADKTEQSSDSAEANSAWTNAGYFIDDQDNHLVIYPTSVETGYSRDGFGAILMIGNEIYSGDLDEKDGKLSGIISVYMEDGTQGKGMTVDLADHGEYILVTKDDGTRMQFVADETDYSDPDFLPMFSYNQVLADINYDSLEAAAYDFLAFHYTKDYDASNVLIPYVQIVDIDETDGDDVLLYGDYYVWEFAREEDTLVAVSGGHCPGVIHLERFGDAGEGAAYSPKDVMDEAFTDDDAKTIFGEYYEQYLTLASDDRQVDSGLSQVIADYVAANNLDITKYQIAEGDTKDLPQTRLK